METFFGRLSITCCAAALRSSKYSFWMDSLYGKIACGISIHSTVDEIDRFLRGFQDLAIEFNSSIDSTLSAG
jgi:hypothetical protein